MSITDELSPDIEIIEQASDLEPVMEELQSTLEAGSILSDEQARKLSQLSEKELQDLLRSVSLPAVASLSDILHTSSDITFKNKLVAELCSTLLLPKVSILGFVY
jgi:hypothetical protein